MSSRRHKKMMRSHTFKPGDVGCTSALVDSRGLLVRVYDNNQVMWAKPSFHLEKGDIALVIATSPVDKQFKWLFILTTKGVGYVHDGDMAFQKMSRKKKDFNA